MNPICVRFLCVVWLCFFCNISQAAITFNFTYADLGTGFDDAIEGLARRNTVSAVGAYINTVVNHNGTIDFHFDASVNQPAANTLASAGSFYALSPGFSNGVTFQHATTGSSPFSAPDASGEVNFGRVWNSDLGAPSGTEFDLFSVILHEVTHAMGFASLLNPNGTSQFAGDGSPNTFTKFDSFLVDGSGNALLSNTATPTFIGSTSVLTSNALFFAGANAMAANGGAPVKLFAPTTFSPGSSISHFDFSVGNSVMVPGISAGVQKREFSALDRAVLADLGWTLHATAVPEPSTYALLLFAGGVYWLAPLRKRTSAKAI
jgi:hypothetical protein